MNEFTYALYINPRLENIYGLYRQQIMADMDDWLRANIDNNNFKWSPYRFVNVPNEPNDYILFNNEADFIMARLRFGL